MVVMVVILQWSVMDAGFHSVAVLPRFSARDHGPVLAVLRAVSSPASARMLFCRSRFGTFLRALFRDSGIPGEGPVKLKPASKISSRKA